MSIKSDYKPDSTWKTRQQIRYHGLLVITLVMIGLLGSLLAYISKPRPEAATAAEPSVKAARDTQTKHPAAAASSSSLLTVRPKYDFYKVLPERQVVISKDEIGARTIKQEMRPATETNAKPAPPAVAGKPAPSSPATSQAKLASTALTDRQSKPQQPPMSNLSAKASGSYFIQVGSFRNYAEADRRKASIAFLGINARIEAKTGADGATLHRVRIGPIEDYNQVQALLQRLQENNIPSVPIKAN